MSEIQVSFKPSLDKVAKKFGAIDVEGFMSRKVQELAFLTEAESKKVTPVATGRLRGSILPIFHGKFKATIGPRNVNYDIYVHDGTRYMRARPFMLWGLKSAIHGFDDRMAKELESYIQEKIK